MLEILAKRSIFVGSLIAMSVMFMIVMLVVNPLIDGDTGLGVLQLQLAFSSQLGAHIVSQWGELGISNFQRFIVADYLYALSYSVFFASVLSVLIIRKGKQHQLGYTWVVYLAFVAGLFDWIENSIQLLFISNPEMVSNSLFIAHSVLASLKWAAVPIAVGYILVLLRQPSTAPALAVAK